MNYKTLDSGKRQEFSTGAVRDTAEGKGRFDLITPIALKRIAGVYERGAKKYADKNWEKGIKIARILDSALRHLNNYLEGNRSEDHLSQAAWNCLAAIHTEEMILRKKLPASLYDGISCYINREEMDNDTASWWDKMHMITNPPQYIQIPIKVKKNRKLKANWTIEQHRDIRALKKINISEELSDALSKNIPKNDLQNLRSDIKRMKKSHKKLCKK